MEPGYLWLIAAVVLVIVEICTVSFGALCFAIAAIPAAIAAFAGLEFVWQAAVFCVGTALSLIFLRPVLMKWLLRKEDEVKTNADALVGREAVVTETVDAATGSGRVKVDGDEWKAVSATGGVIAAGEHVVIEKLDSIILTVKLK